MNCDFTLTPAQQALVESGLPVIDKVIRLFIRPDETVCGLGRDDLYQEGAVALCKAASTYDGRSAHFDTYAAAVIRNHLLNHCKAVNAGQKKLPTVPLDADSQEDGRPPPFPEPSVPDGTDRLIGDWAAAELLSDCKRRYSGVAKLGVEALELKVKGLSGADIALLYGAKPNEVGAWISRAAKKIRRDVVEKRLPEL